MENIRINLPIDVFLRGHHNYREGIKLEDKLIAEAVFKEFISHTHLLKENSLSFQIYKVPYTIYELDSVRCNRRISEELLRDLQPYNLEIMFTEKPIIRIDNMVPFKFVPLPEKKSWWQNLKDKFRAKRIKDEPIKER